MWFKRRPREIDQPALVDALLLAGAERRREVLDEAVRSGVVGADDAEQAARLAARLESAVGPVARQAIEAGRD